MSIQVAPQAWGSVFAVPSAVADEHLKLVSGQQLKVLLYVFRHNGEDLELRDVAEGLGMPAADVADAMQYWVTTGYLLRTEDAVPGQAPAAAAPAPADEAPKPYVRGSGQTSVQPKSESPTKTELQELPDIRPTHETVAARMQEDPAFQGLCREVQGMYGRTIGFDTQATLLMMYDTYGLDPEVILTIAGYCSAHKKGMGYMTKVGKNWAEEGVTTLEAAMEKLEDLERADSAWKEFTAVFTVNPPRMTDARVALVRKWRHTYGQSPELMFYAYERMVEAIDKVNFNYMDKMLTAWQEDGLRTPQEVMQAKKAGGSGDASGQQGSSAKKPGGGSRNRVTGNNHAASYDSDAYREKARGPITYPGTKKTEEGA